MTSNAGESWYNQIRNERLLPIVSLIGGIRSLLMEQICNHRQQATTLPAILCNTIEIEMNSMVDKSRGWDVKKSTNEI